MRQRDRRAHDCGGHRWLLGGRAPGAQAVAAVRAAAAAGRVPVAPRPGAPAAHDRAHIGMKRGIRRVPALWRASRLLRRWYHARFEAYPDWSVALRAEPELWASARRAAAGGPRVLMA